MLQKMNRGLAAGLIMLSVLLLAGFAGKTYTLRYAPKEGAKITYKGTTTVEQTMEMMGQENTTDIAAEVTMTVLVESIDEKGNIAYVVSTDSLRSTIRSMMMDTTLVNPEWIIGKRKRYTVSARGKSISSESIDSVATGGQLAGMMGSVDRSWNLPLLPEKPVAVGDTWSDTVTDTMARKGGEILSTRSMKAVLSAVVDTLGYTCARISYTGDLELNGSFEQQGMKIGFEGEGPMDGTYYVDLKSGLLVAHINELELDATIGMTGQMSMTIPQSSITKSTLVIKK